MTKTPQTSQSESSQPPATLPCTRLGRTGLNVSRLALGTVELGLDYGIPAPGHFGKPPVHEAIRLVHGALDAGLNFIDTARAYGSSEEVLGEALQGRRDKVILASKVATQLPPHTGPAELAHHMNTSLEESLRNLRTDYLDIWQIHNVDAGTLEQADTIAQVFTAAQQAGKIRFTGGSFYGAELPTQALQHDLFDVMQVTYSVLDQRLNDEFLPQATQREIGVVVRSILLKGALTERADYLPSHLAPLTAASQEFRRLVGTHLPHATAPQAAIAFGLANPHIHSVLVGVRTLEEVHENVRAAQLQLPEALTTACATLRIDNADLLNPGTWGIP